MAKERSPNRNKAKQMWLESGGVLKLKDIATELNVGDTQIRKWKNQDGWEAALNSNVTNQSSGNVTKRKGAPIGNKNAVGNRSGAPPGNKRAMGNRGGQGGPEGNKKAVRTGEFETIWLDTLEVDERELLVEIDTDPIRQANDAIALLSIRERRMLQRIKRIVDGLSDKDRRVLYELKTTKSVIQIHDEKSGVTKNVPHQHNEMVETQVEEKEYRKLSDIIALEDALTRVQDKKLKAIELKNRMVDEEKKARIEKMKYDMEQLRNTNNGDTVDDGFIEALKGAATEVWDDEDET